MNRCELNFYIQLLEQQISPIEITASLLERCCVWDLLPLGVVWPVPSPCPPGQGSSRASPHCSCRKGKGCSEWDAGRTPSLSAGPKQPTATTREKSKLSANTIFCLWTWKRMRGTWECCKERGAYISSEAFLQDLNTPFSKLKKAALFMKFNVLTWSIFRR